MSTVTLNSGRERNLKPSFSIPTPGFFLLDHPISDCILNSGHRCVGRGGQLRRTRTALGFSSNFFYLIIYLIAPHGMQDLSSLARY